MESNGGNSDDKVCSSFTPDAKRDLVIKAQKLNDAECFGVLLIFKKYNVSFMENQNGCFVNLTSLTDDIISEVGNFVEICYQTRLKNEERESTLQMLHDQLKPSESINADEDEAAAGGSDDASRIDSAKQSVPHPSEECGPSSHGRAVDVIGQSPTDENEVLQMIKTDKNLSSREKSIMKEHVRQRMLTSRSPVVHNSLTPKYYGNKARLWKNCKSTGKLQTVRGRTSEAPEPRSPTVAKKSNGIADPENELEIEVELDVDGDEESDNEEDDLVPATADAEVSDEEVSEL